MMQSDHPLDSVMSPRPADTAMGEDVMRQAMRQSMGLDFINRSPTGQQFLIEARDFGSVRVARVLGTPCSLTRTRQHLADGHDLLSIVVSAGGRFEVDGVRGNNRYAHRGAGVLESRSVGALHSFDASPAWSVVLDRAPLEPLLAGIGEPLQRCIAGDNPALRMLTGYLETLFSLEHAFDPELACQHVRDLALSALGISADAQAMLRERGVRGARLQMVLTRLAQDCTEPGLDPARFAERLGVSVRYLHRLLEPTGKSFSEHLIGCRLDRAANMLRDPACGSKIADVARLSGFSDISHFNRSFRRHFGDTPLGMRVRTNRKL